MMRARGIVAASVSLVAGIGLTLGGLTLASDTLRSPEKVTPTAPYCMVDREVPEHLTVAGPSGGTITVDGERSGELVLVDAIDYGDEVAPDAGPFDGIQYNVDGPGIVRVDGIECETT